MKTKYITPAVSVMSMAVERIMLDLSYDNQEGDGTQLSKMTPFDDTIEEREEHDYFEGATKLKVQFHDIWAEE